MTEIDRLLGLSIAARRKGLGLSRTDVARMVHLSRATLCDIEAGTRRATARQLFDLADALQVPVRALFPSIAEEAATSAPAPTPAEPGFEGASEVSAHYHALSVPYRTTSFAFLVALACDRDQVRDR